MPSIITTGAGSARGWGWAATIAASGPVAFGSLWAVGNNSSGRLATTLSTANLIQIGTLTNWQFTQSNYATQAPGSVKTDGTLWTWGQSTSGALGNSSSYPPISSPIQIGALTNWLSVSSGYVSAGNKVAVKTDGTLWGWGLNSSGQLGLGNVTSYSSPVQIGVLTNWASVSTTGALTGAVKTTGSLWAWGTNSSGQLMLGNQTNYSSPKQIGALTNWKTVSTFDSFTIAVKTDNTLWGGGNGSSGQLGLNNRTNYSSPKQVGSLTNWSSAFACPYNAIGVKTDNSMWTWGYNANGQVGLGNTSYYSSPKQVGSLTNWYTSSKINQYTGQFIKTNGAMYACGENNFKQTGLTNTTQYSSPVQVGSLTNWSTPNGAYQVGMWIRN